MQERDICFIDSRALRQTLGCYPTGVAVVTTTDSDGIPVGITINSFASVSLEPPLVLWSIRRSSFCFGIFRTAARFLVNVLSSDQRAISKQFACGGPDKWKDVEYVINKSGLPEIIGAVAVLECKISHEIEGGDHAIFLSAVADIQCYPEKTPLIFHLGVYRDLLGVSEPQTRL